MSDIHAITTAMQLPKALLTLTAALAQNGADPTRAAVDADVIAAWAEAEPETRACILLSAAYDAGAGAAPAVPGGMVAHVDDYVRDFHQYAAAFNPGRSEEFHGKRFPAMPLPGQAGALASSLGFDRDDLDISLGVALVLLAAGRAAAQ